MSPSRADPAHAAEIVHKMGSWATARLGQPASHVADLHAQEQERRATGRHCFETRQCLDKQYSSGQPDHAV